MSALPSNAISWATETRFFPSLFLIAPSPRTEAIHSASRTAWSNRRCALLLLFRLRLTLTRPPLQLQQFLLRSRSSHPTQTPGDPAPRDRVKKCPSRRPPRGLARRSTFGTCC